MNRHERRTRKAIAERAARAIQAGKPVTLPPGMSVRVVCGLSTCKEKATHILRHYIVPTGKTKKDVEHRYSLYCEAHARSEAERGALENTDAAGVEHVFDVEPWDVNESRSAMAH